MSSNFLMTPQLVAHEAFYRYERKTLRATLRKRRLKRDRQATVVIGYPVEWEHDQVDRITRRIASRMRKLRQLTSRWFAWVELPLVEDAFRVSNPKTGQSIRIISGYDVMRNERLFRVDAAGC